MHIMGFAHLLVVASAALASAGMIVCLRPAARTLGLIDRPGGRKAHDLPVPVVGGLAMYLGLAPFVFTSPTPTAYGLATALGILALVGALDDRRPISARTRLFAEFAAAAIIIASGDSVRYLGDLLGFGPIGTSVLAPAFTLVCFVGASNAMNMSDGLDGLAGSLALVACGWFTVIALAAGNAAVAGIGAAAIGVVIGFLVFNLRTPWRKRATVFMGDAGSMVLGFLLAWFAIELAGERPSLLTPIGAVWILAVPLLDMGSVMLSRLKHRVSPFAGDRRHIHYVLVDGGMSVPQAVGVKVAAAVICGAIGAGFPLVGIPEWVMFAAFLVLWLLTYKWIARGHDAKVAAGANAAAAADGDVIAVEIISPAAVAPDSSLQR